jgi:hypothetical protein
MFSVELQHKPEYKGVYHPNFAGVVSLPSGGADDIHI